MNERNTQAEQWDYLAGDVPGDLLTLTESIHKMQTAGKIVSPLPTDEELYAYLGEQRETWTSSEITEEREQLLGRMQYEHVYGKGLEPEFEHNSFFKRAGGKVLTYAENFHETRHKKGKDEAAEWGYAEVGGHRVVVFTMNYEFIGGSLSVVAGDVFDRAAKAAVKNNLPLVNIYSTGGARQQENTAALFQMDVLVAAQDDFKEQNPDCMVISVLLGEVWGGITASSMPEADLRIAYTGSHMGFAGSRVIQSSRGAALSYEVIAAAQRVEAHAVRRNVDVLVADTDELLDVLGDSIGRVKEHGKKDKQAFSEDVLAEQALRPELLKAGGRMMDLGKTAVVSSVKAIRHQDARQSVLVAPRGEPAGLDKEALLDLRYRNIMYDASRADADMFISYALRNPAQFYNRFVDAKGNIIYPRFIAAIGTIGLQPFMVLGHQASFFVHEDGYKKFPSIPRTNDFKYALRMLEMGARFKLPLITIADTLGAEASIEAEHAGQFEQIAKFLKAYKRYPAPIVSMVTGMLGSGGGLTAGTRADSLAMTERSLLMVAEPRSAASIVYNTNYPTKEQERLTLLAMDPSSENQHAIGMVDAVIPESDNPYKSVIAMRDHVITTYMDLSKHSLRALMRERNRRRRRVPAFDIVDSGTGKRATLQVVETAD